MSPAGTSGKNRGFLLLEIMVSISILSLGILLILNSFVGPIRAVETSMDYFKAGLLLEDKMLEFYNSPVEEGLLKGSFNDFENRFSWYLEAVKVKDSFHKEINFKVFWQRRNKEEDLSISTYI